MSELQREQAAIDQEIADALFDIVPEEWTAVRMTVERRAGVDGDPFTLAIANPNKADTALAPSPEVFGSVMKLVALLAQHRRLWTQVIYNGTLNDDGAWNLTIKVPPTVKNA